jgi:hypothetical protein
MPSAISSLSGAEANLTCTRIRTRAADISNVIIAELIQDRSELPAFSTLERITKHVRCDGVAEAFAHGLPPLDCQEALATAFVESRSTPKRAATSMPARWSPPATTVAIVSFGDFCAMTTTS